MSDTQIYYIHGFGSSPQSDTLKMLQKEFPDAIGLTYDYNCPGESLTELVKFIRSASIVSGTHPIIIGSSLGGWYAEMLTRYVVADFILYNPSMNPEVTLARHGLPQEVLFKYKEISSPYKFLPCSRNVLLSRDDEIIDPMIAAIKYEHIANVMFTSGGHRMTEMNMNYIVSIIKYSRNQLC
jgi:predicted esterase YcpF (UPF0227 family)